MTHILLFKHCTHASHSFVKLPWNQQDGTTIDIRVQVRDWKRPNARDRIAY